MILKVLNIKDLHSTIFILKQALFKLSISVPFIFTFYNIYIKTIALNLSVINTFNLHSTIFILKPGLFFTVFSPAAIYILQYLY